MSIMTTDTAGTEAAFFGASRETFPYPVVARFTVEGEPSSKARPRFTTRGGKVAAYTPTKTINAQAAMAAEFLRANVEELTKTPDAEYGVVGLFFNGTRQRRDVDNMLKLILDGLNGIAWHDDSQVVEVTGRKVHVVDKAHARTEVLIYRLGRMYRMEAVCQQCGERYETWPSTAKTAKYCSRACGLEFRRLARTRACEQCGTSFEAHGTGRTTRFCSIACNSAAKSVEVQCDHCGAKFTRRKSAVRPRNFCTPEHRDAAMLARRKTATRRPGGTCADCGGSTSKKTYKRCLECNLKAIASKRTEEPA